MHTTDNVCNEGGSGRGFSLPKRPKKVWLRGCETDKGKGDKNPDNLIANFFKSYPEKFDRKGC